jgi:hypothetical protein
MCQVAEEFFAKRVVAHVLDGATPVRVSVRLGELGVGASRKPAEQQRANRILPRQIDELLVG